MPKFEKDNQRIEVHTTNDRIALAGIDGFNARGEVEFSIIGNFLEIRDINAQPEGQKLGSVLIRAAAELGKKSECTLIKLTLVAKTQNAQVFYGSMGFKPSANHIDEILKGPYNEAEKDELMTKIPVWEGDIDVILDNSRSAASGWLPSN